MLTAQELERYARHIVMHEIGGPGQAALKAARVLVIGADHEGAAADHVASARSTARRRSAIEGARELP